MAVNDSRLDVLLISEEFVQDEFQSFRSFQEWLQGHASSFSYEVKEKLEQLYGVQDFLRQVSGGGQDPGADSYQIRLPNRPSLALCDLATVIKAAGYSVCILDNFVIFPWRRRQLHEIVTSHSPRLIGISTTFLLSSQMVRDVVRELREISPDSRIVLGGPTARSDQSLHGCADFAVFGEGEIAILAILEVLDGKREASSIANIAYLDDEGNLRYGSGARETAHVGETGKAYKARAGEIMPIPDWTLYNRSRQLVYGIEFARGCKYNCFYCGYDRGKITRDLEEIKIELLTNAEQGITTYRTADSNFTDGPPRNKRYPYDICQLKIDLDLGLQWSCYSRVDDLTDELADLMKRAGCFALFFGIESGDDRILKLMRKGHDVADAYKGIEIAKKHGLFVHANFVVGYPGETSESYMNTIEFIERSKPDSVAFSQLYLVPQSPVYGKKMKEFDIRGIGGNWDHKTMDSATAAELATEGTNYLTNAGIVIGTETDFQNLMSVGWSVDEVKQILLARSYKNKVVSNAPRVSTQIPLWLARMATEVAKDQKSMVNCGF